MQKANFTLDQLIDEVRKLANEKPDFAYFKPPEARLCSYTRSATSETEGCIFGQAILRLQPELRDSLTDCGIINLLKLLEVIGPYEADRHDCKNKVYWCAYVQNRQDYGNTWASSIDYADRKVNAS